MNVNFSTRAFKRLLLNILSIVVILAMAFATTGFSVQASPRVLPGDWDARAVQKVSIMKELDGYKMWYDGVNFFDQTQIGLATSPDGTSWTKYSDNPVLIGGSEAWDSSGEHAPFVMKDGDSYKMWYEGSDGNVRQLGYATSPDGINWTKSDGNPVLRAGPDGYDQSVAGHGSVLYEDGVYKLWYHAIGDQGAIIAYATSADGIQWDKHGPVLVGTADGWDSGLWGPSVLKVNALYWMWYAAAGSVNPSIGLATSEDGVTWTRMGDAPVINIADKSLGDPHVIVDGQIFKMWINNFSDGAIYYAESSDGINWGELSSVLSPGLLFPLEGWHDGIEGEVDPGACVASGWSADPDDRDRDVQIRVLSDGEQVAEGLAQDYGEDMVANNICPGGTCRFTINLWGMISADEAHEITVQAYDVESDAWWNLEGTPRSLTCLTPVPRVYANLPEDGIRFEYSAPGGSVAFSIYDSPDGNLLWEGSRAADDSGFVYLSIWDHRVDLKPGIYIVASDGTFTKQLLIEPVSINLFDPVENIMQGTASPDRTVWVVANNESIFCGTDAVADSNGNWTVDFDDHACDVTDDMWAYAQAVDAEGDTSEAVPNFIEGYHDYDSGDVPTWACNVGGWVVDSNDRERDLTIRILANGNEVTSLTAGNPREDLLGACGADGSCGFEVNLWGLITPYEEHQITVQAKDEETDQWFNLHNTPKTLTCRTYDIYAYDPLTGQTKLITTDLNETDEYNPSWSPNGKKVAHDVVSGDSASIYITDVKTGASTPLAGAENGGNDAVWSPNGRWIVFDRAFDEVPSLYLVPATGGTPILVKENAVSADWAPSGKRLVFQHPSDGSIRTVPVDGGQGGETFIVGSGANPAWSPDGNWIAYEKDGDIWKVQVNVQGTVFGDPAQVTSGAFADGQPTWSADSTMIVYHSGFNDADYDLWTIPAAGGEPTWLTGAPNFGDYDPAYAKKSSAIAYGSFSPNGQAPRSWVAAFTYDLPVGYWTEGTHTYHFETSGPDNSSDLSFDVGNDKPLYDGTVLLRPWSVIGRTGEECLYIDASHPNQPTKFYVGWTADGTYSDALTYYENLMAKVAWDDNEPVDLEMHEVFPITPPVDWFGYTCTYTAGPPPARVTVQITDDWLRAENFTPSGQATFWLYDAEDNLLVHPNTTWQLDGSGYVTISTWELEEYIDLIPGYRLVVSDGTFIKEVVLEDLHFDAINLAAGQLWGSAPEPFGRRVWVGIGWENDYWSMEVNTDGFGSWVASFDQPVPGDYSWMAAQIFDADGDASEVRPSTIIDWAPVIANQPDWVNSGIPVSAGQSFTIQALGLMNPCADSYPNGDEICIFYTPVGAEWAVPYDNQFGIFPAPGARFMALLGRIGDEEPFYVGEGGTFTATQSGTLWFTPNDNLRTDNQGAYSLLVWIEP